MAQLKAQGNAKSPALRTQFRKNAAQLTAMDWIDKGLALYDGKSFIPLEAAIAFFDKAVKTDPNSSMAYSLRAVAFYNKFKKGKDQASLKLALGDNTRAIELEPKHPAAYNNRGNVYSELGQYNQALKNYNKSIELDSKHTNAYINRGNVYVELKQFNQALKNYNKSIELDPKHTNAYINRGNVYSELKKYNQAINDYNRSIELNSKNALTYSYRGIIYQVLKQYGRAIKDYDRAIRINPNDGVSYNNKAWLLATCPEESCRDGEEAVRMAKKAVKINGGPGIRDTLAAAYAEAGRFEDAVREEKKAISMLGEKVSQKVLEGLKKRLKSYQQGKPWREP